MNAEPPFLKLAQIRAHAQRILTRYENLRKCALTFPLDAEDLVRRVWGLDVYYDGEGFLDKRFGTNILAVLFHGGEICPLTGSDRVIVVNDAPRFRRVTIGFSILHEGGHEELHARRGYVPETQAEKGFYCRSDVVTEKDKRPQRIELQANRFAGEVYMPVREVQKVLGNIPMGETVLLANCKSNLCEAFGASEKMVEKRLVDLGYRLVGARYFW